MKKIAAHEKAQVCATEPAEPINGECRNGRRNMFVWITVPVYIIIA